MCLYRHKFNATDKIVTSIIHEIDNEANKLLTYLNLLWKKKIIKMDISLPEINPEITIDSIKNS